MVRASFEVTGVLVTETGEGAGVDFAPHPPIALRVPYCIGEALEELAHVLVCIRLFEHPHPGTLHMYVQIMHQLRFAMNSSAQKWATWQLQLLLFAFKLFSCKLSARRRYEHAV